MTCRKLLTALLVTLPMLALVAVGNGTAATADTTGPSLRVQSSTMCVGDPVGLGGTGFDPGQTYLVTASQGSLQAATVVAATDGTLADKVTPPEGMLASGSITVTVATADAPDTAVTSLVVSGFRAPYLVPDYQLMNWMYTTYPVDSLLDLYAYCFKNGENISLSSSAMTFASHWTSWDQPARAFLEDRVVSENATGSVLVTATGATSGRHGTILISAGGAVLDAGAQLDSTANGQLMAGGYHLIITSDGLHICEVVNEACHVTWSKQGWSGSSASLQLQTSGNLVLLIDGRQVWSTGTAGAGSQLTMREDGNLVLTSARGDVQWSSNTGLIRGADGYFSFAYIAGSRAHSAVYVNGLVKQWNRAGQLVRGTGRVVYLQRMLNGSWQNVLSRTADSAGQLAVGFIQSKAYSYRLLVLAATGVAGSQSAVLVR